MYIYIYICIYLSLSLYMYIYIYIYTYLQPQPDPWLQIVCFFSFLSFVMPSESILVSIFMYYMHLESLV